VAYDPIAGVFVFYDGTEQQDPPSDTCVCTLSTNHKESTVFFPETFRVYFPAGWISYNSWNGTLLTSGPTVDSDNYTDILTEIENVKAGTIAQIVYPVAESTALTIDDVAIPLAARHTLRIKLQANCGYRQYQGVLNPALPGAEIAEIRWFDHGGGQFTELYGQNTTAVPWGELYRPVVLAVGGGGAGDPNFYYLLEPCEAGGYGYAILFDDNGDPTTTTAHLHDKMLRGGGYTEGQVVYTLKGSVIILGGTCTNMEV
jgi:hypothetical protein